MIGGLNKDGKFCALGVACHLMATELKVTEGTSGYTLYDGCNAFLPHKVTKALGLKCPGNIMHMNDGLGLSFEEIANRLSEKPDDYFH